MWQHDRARTKEDCEPNVNIHRKGWVDPSQEHNLHIRNMRIIRNIPNHIRKTISS